MSIAGLDGLIHAPARLAIVSLLAAAQWADFRYIRDELSLSDSALSKQLSALESAGYVEIRKSFVGKRPRTSASLTETGRQAFRQHVAALEQIIARSQEHAATAPAAEPPGAEPPRELARWWCQPAQPQGADRGYPGGRPARGGGESARRPTC